MGLRLLAKCKRVGRGNTLRSEGRKAGLGGRVAKEGRVTCSAHVAHREKQRKRKAIYEEGKAKKQIDFKF